MAGADLLRRSDRAQQAWPLVLVIDDAHLADGPSLAALTFSVATTAQSSGLGWWVAARDEGVARLPPGWLHLVAD